MRNVNDSDLLKRIQEIETLLRANPLRAASVERGRTRFYAGSELLIEDSNMTVTGTATVWGTLRTIGRIILEGLGILTVHGLIELFGNLRVRSGGGITVEGGGDIEVDGGEIRTGNVRIADGKIYVGVGGGQIVIDGTTGKVIAGNVEVEQNRVIIGGADGDTVLENSKMTFANGAEVRALSGGGVQIVNGNAAVQAGGGSSGVYHPVEVNIGPNPANVGIEVTPGMTRLLNGNTRVPNVTAKPSGVTLIPLGIDPSTYRIHLDL